MMGTVDLRSVTEILDRSPHRADGQQTRPRRAPGRSAGERVQRKDFARCTWAWRRAWLAQGEGADQLTHARAL